MASMTPRYNHMPQRSEQFLQTPAGAWTQMQSKWRFVTNSTFLCSQPWVSFALASCMWLSSFVLTACRLLFIFQVSCLVEK